LVYFKKITETLTTLLDNNQSTCFFISSHPIKKEGKGEKQRLEHYLAIDDVIFGEYKLTEYPAGVAVRPQKPEDYIKNIIKAKRTHLFTLVKRECLLKLKNKYFRYMKYKNMPKKNVIKNTIQAKNNIFLPLIIK
jgi:hypothetical protein